MGILVFIAGSTLFGVCGQLALKHGMSKIANADGKDSLILTMALSPWVVGGLATYGFGVLFWLMALSRYEVSYVYPFASLSYVGIIIGSYYVFNERINRLRLVGISIIIAGVIIAGLSVN
jgi:multidrug transporter EmrE-like cation transporter